MLLSSLIVLPHQFAVAFLTYKAIEDVATESGNLDVIDVIDRVVFKNIVSEGILIIGAHIASSLLFVSVFT